MQLFIILVSEDNSTKKFFNGDTLVHNFDTVVRPAFGIDSH